MRYAPDNPGVQYTGVQGGYLAYINLSTPYGISITRILVKNKPGDIDNVHQYQNKMSIVKRPGFSVSDIPPFNLTTFTDPYYQPGPNVSLELAVLRLTAVFSEHNKPVVPQDRSCVANLLSNAGIAKGSFNQPPNTNLTAASAAADASVAALRTMPGIIQNMGNNWTLTQPMGYYGSFYQMRYSIAIRGYLAITKQQTVYPVSPAMKLAPDEACVFRFSRKPRLSDGGFWSLTAYNQDLFLIPNPLKRYALGDRSNMIFPDGSSLSGKSDGPFEILIQPSDVTPPANWTSK